MRKCEVSILEVLTSYLGQYTTVRLVSKHEIIEEVQEDNRGKYNIVTVKPKGQHCNDRKYTTVRTKSTNTQFREVYDPL
jgi:hypothetical protein